MKLYVVKDRRSIHAGPITKDAAQKVADTFNRDYQTDEFYVEEWSPERFAAGFNFRLVDGQ